MSKHKTDPETGEIKDYKSMGGKEYAPPFIRTPYNYNMDEASVKSGLACNDPTRTQQHDKEDADINTLVKRFGLTGTMPQLDRVPLQGDFHNITDFQSAMNALVEARDQFMKLPADTRKEFDNDPHQFLEFTSNEKNKDKMREMGLLKPVQAEPEPIKVRVIPDPTPPTGGTP